MWSEERGGKREGWERRQGGNRLPHLCVISPAFLAFSVISLSVISPALLAFSVLLFLSVGPLLSRPLSPPLPCPPTLPPLPHSFGASSPHLSLAHTASPSAPLQKMQAPSGFMGGCQTIDSSELSLKKMIGAGAYGKVCVCVCVCVRERERKQ